MLRWMIVGIAGVISFALVSLAIFLVPAHVQTQGIEPALPTAQALRALSDVDNGPASISYLVNAYQPAVGRQLSHTSIVIEWANGNIFIIDAGMDEAAAAEFADLMKTMGGGGEATFVGTIADQLGDDVSRVAGVGFTHLHIDHTQGLNALCDARGVGAVSLQTDLQRNAHNFNTTEGAEIIANSCLEPAVLTGDTVLTNEMFPGLGLIAIGGHTPGSTLFAAYVDNHLWLFSGDTTNSMQNLQSNTGKGFLYSNIFVPENTGRTQELRLMLRELNTEDDIDVVVSHDLEALISTGMNAF
jgi:glyoxylase-like metal-dependent hydrolase (beta-lactamase superfamily II)